MAQASDIWSTAVAADNNIASVVKLGLEFKESIDGSD
jgi:hypothetical protein